MTTDELRRIERSIVLHARPGPCYVVDCRRTPPRDEPGDNWPCGPPRGQLTLYPLRDLERWTEDEATIGGRAA
jgi:hypothetical protein